MDFQLQNRVVLVTASSKGLGLATAKAFAAEGANVMMSSRDEQSVRKAAEKVAEDTGNQNVSYFAADMAQADNIERLFAHVEQTYGTVDVLINNAGGPPAGNFDSVTEAQWLSAFELSLMSVVRATKLALPGMRNKHWGRIVNFTSSSIKQPIDNLILSNTYRTAVAGLGKSLAIELASDNILVNTLGPGRIATDRVASLDEIRARNTGKSPDEVRQEAMAQIPMGRYGRVEEFAATALFLGSGANGYLTGQSILVDGGMVRSL